MANWAGLPYCGHKARLVRLEKSNFRPTAAGMGGHCFQNKVKSAWEPIMKKQPRWMKSAITAAAGCQTVMPFQRGAKKLPASLKPVVRPRASAAAR